MYPRWDLQLVLQALRGAPFEPLSSRRLGWLTWKTAFLLAVSTAKRVSEIQAFSKADRYYSDTPDGIRLRLNPFFMPKVMKDDYREQEMFITPFCPRRDSTSTQSFYLVCPCRAIRKYVEATQSFRKSDQLLVCYSGPNKGKGATKMTIARWVRRCIQEAYKAVGREPPQGVKAHSTRAVAASWAQFNNTSLLDICKTASWSSSCTFATYYQLNLAGNSSTARFAANVLQSVLEGRPR